jgi:hypothetical protein
VEQLNPNNKVLQLSENTTIDNKSTEDVSTAPLPTKTDDEVLTLIGDESINRSTFHDMGEWTIRISDTFRDFTVKTETNQLQNSDIFLRMKVEDY